MRPLPETVVEQGDKFVPGLGRSFADSLEEGRDVVRFGGHREPSKKAGGPWRVSGPFYADIYGRSNARSTAANVARSSCHVKKGETHEKGVVRPDGCAGARGP